MPDFTQAGRPFRLTVQGLGPDDLLCAAWQCSEAVSSLWELRVEALSPRQQIAPAEVLLKAATLTCEYEGQPARHFAGIVRRLERLPVDREAPLHGYVLTIVPPAWQLDRRPVYQGYHDVDAQEVVDDVFGAFRLAKPEWDIKRGPLPKRRGVTAWNETPWRFVSRLLEREGLWYVFRCTESACDVFIGDGSVSATMQHGVEQLSDTDVGRGAPRLRSAALVQGAPRAASAWTFTAHHAKFGEHLNEKVPLPENQGPAVWDVAGIPHVNVDWESLHDWHLAREHDDVALDGAEDAGRLTTLDEQLKRQARLRAEAILGESSRLRGESTAQGVASGAFVKVAVSNDHTLDGGYMVLGVHHAGGNGSYRGGDDAQPFYENAFECVPADTPWSPPRPTPAPRVPGVVLATVVGPKGEEIHTDKYGRIRVQFDWDGRRLDKKPGPGDAWVWVAQPVAGTGWGAFFLPRIGQQVIVSFLDGDPDAPYCVGSVYNGTNMPLQKLPAEKTQSGIRTRSTPKGDAKTFNELRFEDKKGEEHVWFRAQSQFTGWVTNNVTVHIEEGDQAVTHKKGNRILTHEEGDDEHVMKKGSRTVQLAEGDDALTLDKGNLDVKLKDGAWTQVVSKAITVESTEDAIEITAAKTITIKATDKIELVVGGSTVTITSDTIELKSGAASHTVSSSDVVSKVAANQVSVAQNGVDVKGTMVGLEGKAMTKIASNGMLQAKGSINMIG